VPGPGALPLTAILLGAASLILFGIIIAAIWVAVPDRVLQAVRAVAPTLAVVSTIIWIGGRNARRSADINETLAENNGVALDTLWNLTRHASGRLTGPLRRVK
jgi:hypothetical protein